MPPLPGVALPPLPASWGSTDNVTSKKAAIAPGILWSVHAPKYSLTLLPSASPLRPGIVVAQALDAALNMYWVRRSMRVAVADSWARFFAETQISFGGPMRCCDVEQAICMNLLGDGLANSAASWVTRDDLSSLFALVDSSGSGTVTPQQWQLRLYRLELERSASSDFRDSEVPAAFDNISSNDVYTNNPQAILPSHATPRKNFTISSLSVDEEAFMVLGQGAVQAANEASDAKHEVEEGHDWAVQETNDEETRVLVTNCEGEVHLGAADEGGEEEALEEDAQVNPEEDAMEGAHEQDESEPALEQEEAREDVYDDDTTIRPDVVAVEFVSLPAIFGVAAKMEPLCKMIKSVESAQCPTLTLLEGQNASRGGARITFPLAEEEAEKDEERPVVTLDSTSLVAPCAPIDSNVTTRRRIRFKSSVVASAAGTTPQNFSRNIAMGASASTLVVSSDTRSGVRDPRCLAATTSAGLSPPPTLRRGDSPPAASLALGQALFGHTLRPKELGRSVAVIGNGWGSHGGGYKAVITEADDLTFTVISVNGWKETHVLRSCCVDLGFTGIVGTVAAQLPSTIGSRFDVDASSPSPNSTSAKRARRTAFISPASAGA